MGDRWIGRLLCLIGDNGVIEHEKSALLRSARFFVRLTASREGSLFGRFVLVIMSLSILYFKFLVDKAQHALRTT